MDSITEVSSFDEHVRLAGNFKVFAEKAKKENEASTNEQSDFNSNQRKNVIRERNKLLGRGGEFTLDIRVSWTSPPTATSGQQWVFETSYVSCHALGCL